MKAPPAEFSLDALRRAFFASAHDAAGEFSEALLDFPMYPNPGDLLIWRGQCAWFDEVGVRLIESLRMNNQHRARRITARHPEAIVFQQGGGNWGDLYPEHQRLRHEALCDLASSRIVQFPQSLNYRDERHAQLTDELIRRHGRVTLMWRDEASFERALTLLPSARNLLAPDAAFGVSSLPGLPSGGHRFAAVIRTDVESAGGTGLELPDLQVGDWQLRGRERLRWKAISLIAQLEGRAKHAVLTPSLWRRQYEWLASASLGSALQLLKMGKIAITDRLHGHVLCLLIGQLHVVLPDKFGKIVHLRETWTSTAPLAWFAASVEDASSTALAMEEWTGSAAPALPQDTRADLRLGGRRRRVVAVCSGWCPPF